VAGGWTPSGGGALEGAVPPPQKKNFTPKNAGFYAFFIAKNSTCGQKPGPGGASSTPWGLNM